VHVPGFERCQGLLFCAEVMTRLQDVPIDIANFYTADSLINWSVFRYNGAPLKIYYAFRAYHEVCQLAQRVAITSSAPQMFSAGRGGGG